MGGNAWGRSCWVEPIGPFCHIGWGHICKEHVEAMKEGVLKMFECFGNVFWHGEINGAVFIVPV